MYFILLICETQTFQNCPEDPWVESNGHLLIKFYIWEIKEDTPLNHKFGFACLVLLKKKKKM